MNGILGWESSQPPYLKVPEVESPSQSFIFIEESDPRNSNLGTWVLSTDSKGWIDPFAVFHGNFSTFSFQDGHYEGHKWVEAKVLKTSAGSGTNTGTASGNRCDAAHTDENPPEPIHDRGISLPRNLLLEFSGRPEVISGRLPPGMLPPGMRPVPKAAESRSQSPSSPMRQTDPNLLLAATTNRELLGSAADLSNEPAWKSLWDRYQKPILRLCEQSGLTAAESQDVVQDAFLRVARMLESRRLEPMQNGFRRWLGHIVHRLIFEAHRRNRRHQLGVEAVKRLKIWLPAVEAPADDSRAREHMEGHLWSVCLARVR